MTTEELVAHFEAAEVPPDGFHHAEHVRVAWWYARQDPWHAALDRLRVALRLLAEARGKPQLYHETITTAFLVLVAERLQNGGRDQTWEAFAASNADLLAWNPSILDRYYRPATLASELARRTFVLPDAR